MVTHTFNPRAGDWEQKQGLLHLNSELQYGQDYIRYTGSKKIFECWTLFLHSALDVFY